MARVVNVGEIDLAMLTEDNIAETGEVLDGFDDELADYGLDLTAITDQLKAAAARISANVAAAQNQKLMHVGKKIAGNAIWAATKPFPKRVRRWVQPDFPEPQPSPKWITDITDPLLAPVIRGAQIEAFRAAGRLKGPLYASLTLIFLTIFGGGYMLGRVVTKRTG